jgi:hypothetical protein
MTSKSSPNRRSFVARILGGTLVAGGAAALIHGPTRAERTRECISNSDRSDRVSCHYLIDADVSDSGNGHWSDDDSSDLRGHGRGPAARRAPSATVQGQAQNQNSSNNAGGARQTQGTTTRSTGH